MALAGFADDDERTALERIYADGSDIDDLDDDSLDNEDEDLDDGDDLDEDDVDEEARSFYEEHAR